MTKVPSSTKGRRAAKPATGPDVAGPDAPIAAGAFPIVGIGASAGGLEALEQFLRHVPPQSGMAYVVVQHLDPDHKDLMAELLQRTTSMPVQQITDRQRVQPNQVYVIPPNRELSILHGVLHLLEPDAPRGRRLPIDFFLRALAADRQERAIGVILSGMGSDGTQGLGAIKANAGAVFVQDPATAKFDGMPRSAIDAGLADVVAPAEALAGRIVSYLGHTPLPGAPDTAPLSDKDQSGLEKVVLILRAQTGHDFSLYKKSTLYRRIERRMALHQLPSIADYVRFLRENPQEAALLFKELLIGVTSFFRDPEAWEQLQGRSHPDAAGSTSDGGHAACLGHRLLHRRGSLFAGHRLSRGAGHWKRTTRPHPAIAADVCHRSRPRCHSPRPHRRLPGQHRQRSLAERGCAASSCRTNGATG
jgi:two-component system CheB/CheR fusion protein